MKSALQQRKVLGGNVEDLESELNTVSVQLDQQLHLIQNRLQRTKRLQTVFEGNKATIEYWNKGDIMTLSKGKNDGIIADMKEKEHDIMSALSICLRKLCLSCDCHMILLRIEL